MPRRFIGTMHGERYLANIEPAKHEVHDLDNETASCQIDEILLPRHAKPYDSREAANRDGFNDCAYCIQHPAS